MFAKKSKKLRFFLTFHTTFTIMNNIQMGSVNFQKEENK